jgi:hypothetical protein
MAEVGIDIAAEQPKILTNEAVKASDVAPWAAATPARFTPANATKTGYSKTQPARETTPYGRLEMRFGVGSRASSAS